MMDIAERKRMIMDADVMGIWEEYGYEIQNIPDSLLPSFALTGGENTKENTKGTFFLCSLFCNIICVQRKSARDFPLFSSRMTASQICVLLPKC
jgi:hypothetical protein